MRLKEFCCSLYFGGGGGGGGGGGVCLVAFLFFGFLFCFGGVFGGEGGDLPFSCPDVSQTSQ